MKKLLFTMIATSAFVACTQHQNPFLSEWDTPYGIPPFSQIQVDDYIPAIEAGIRQQNDEIAAIVACGEAPTFDNTVLPLELSGGILKNVSGVLFNVAETDQTPALDSVMELAVPMLSEHEDNMTFNRDLYARLKAIHDGDQSLLTREQQMVVRKHFERFELGGVGLPEEQQAKLKAINSGIASLQQKIGNNILAESNAFKERFGIAVSDYPNAMAETADRDLRRQMLEAYTSRGHHDGENDNRPLILELMRLRIEKAQIMGKASPAEYLLQDKMAATPEAVDSFLLSIMQAATGKARLEVVDMQQLMDRDVAAGLLPAGSRIEPWDWWYYAEQVRKQKYDLDEQQTKTYFKLENVVKGIFTAAEWLYGIHAEPLSDVPAYNETEVQTYRISDEKGDLVGIFTTDYLPRASKRGGAWMNNVREQYVDKDGQMVRPIIVNVGNLQQNLTIDEVQTVFHEFGHALHGLLTQCHYPSVSGTSVKHDFVEVFSQINENWAFQPRLLAEYAVNDRGEVIPDSLVAKINNALRFNQGFMTTELCAASLLDMRWHELTTIDGVDIDRFEADVCREMGLIPEIGPRYRTTYFNHIFSSGGYSAGYYGYLWAEVLDKDLFSIFEASGDVFNPELARKFKETFLEKGGSEEPMVLFQQFAGRQPNNAAFLRARGL